MTDSPSGEPGGCSGCFGMLVSLGALLIALLGVLIIGAGSWWGLALVVPGVLLLVGYWILAGLVSSAPPSPVAIAESEKAVAAPAPRLHASAGVANRRLRVRVIETDGLKVVDLRHLDSMRTRIVGSGYNVDDAEREHYSAMSYLLIPEPDNPADKRAIAVYSKGRRLGYVSAKRAAMMQPLLAKIDADAFLVAGTGITPNSIVMFLDLPRVPALREFAELRPS